VTQHSHLPKLPRAEQLAATNGWLTPDGVLYPCDYGSHGKTCRQLGYRFLNGFTFDPRLCHLSQSKWLRMSSAQPTQEQLTTIWEWCHHHHRRMPHWIEHAAQGETHGQKAPDPRRKPNPRRRRR
jgi:hypothetical protein